MINILQILFFLVILLACSSKNDGNEDSEKLSPEFSFWLQNQQQDQQELFFRFNQEPSLQMTYFKASVDDQNLDKISFLKEIEVLSLSGTKIQDLTLLTKMVNLKVLILRDNQETQQQWPDSFHFSVITDSESILDYEERLIANTTLIDSRNGCYLMTFYGFWGEAYSFQELMDYKNNKYTPVFQGSENLVLMDGSPVMLKLVGHTTSEDNCEDKKALNDELLKYFNAK